ncbi:MAG: CRISPR-associated endonuclease Cas2 [Candidatus Paceibacterota bacterium]
MNYKGYRVGLIEKELLKFLLGIKNKELPKRYSESFSDIFKTARQKYSYPETIKRMEKKGLINFINREGELRIILTNKGKSVARSFLLQDYKQFKKPIRWDGKWRLVMFDIPENKRKLRNIIRFHLKKIGFLQVQGSVWVYPYPCEEIITIIKTNFNFDDEIIYITANSFEKDFRFKKIFKL